jgi:hypothetical protein
MPNPDPPADAFTGWLRPQGKSWRPVCCARTEDECLDLLLAEPGAGHSDLIVLAKGRQPSGQWHGRGEKRQR